MSKVVADITMSLDGYVAPPGADSPEGVADVDELQAWVMNQDPVDTEILERATAATGAVVMGRRLFDIVDAPGVWTKEMAYGAQPAGTIPFFVVTHAAPPRRPAPTGARHAVHLRERSSGRGRRGSYRSDQ
jgi:dihydrofolate reductase